MSLPNGGAPGGRRCEACGQANEPDAFHCDRCGARLTPPTAGAAPSGGRRAALIGAGEGCDLRVDRPEVSGVHAVATLRAGVARLWDLGSTNGTFIDGEPAPARGIGAPLTPRSQVSLGGIPVSGAHVLAALSRGQPAALIGREPDCDLILDLPVVSAYHALALSRGEELLVVDLGSSNGTRVRAAHGEGAAGRGPSAVGREDAVLLGSVRLPAARLWAALAPPAPKRVQAGAPHPPGPVSAPLPPVGGSITLGRETGCDLVVASPQISARHARITRRGPGRWLVEDLGSLNGVFVNGEVVRQAEVPPGGRLAIGTLPVRIDEARGLVTVGALRGALRLDAVGVSAVVPDRRTGAPITLVDGVSVSIYPSELVGLMGLAGAGKTTFMLALNGYQPPSHGEVRINGDDLYRHFDQYRGLIGYVPQDDLMHGELTVEEAVRYAAQLRLPPDTTAVEIEAAIDRVLGELNLNDQRHLRIGSPEAKVLSGGQRKRVNLALELVTDPVLLFLDEPTSGLSARDTRDVMEVLRGLADNGRTLILTIHQPSREAYERMDHVIYLAKGGKLAYFGPTAPDSYRYFQLSQPSPDGILDALEARSADQWKAAYLGSEVHREFVAERQSQAPDREALRPEVERRSAPVPQLSQGITLLRRYTRIKLRDHTNLAFMIAQAPVVGALLALTFHDADEKALGRGTPLFILCIAVIFFGCFNACREIVTERAIFLRERMVNLKLLPYLLSKFVFLAVVGILQSAALLAIAQKWIGLEGDPLAYLGIFSLASVASTALGLWISTLVRSVEAAMAMVPIVLVFQMVLAGSINPLRAEGKEYLETLAAPMISRWALEGSLDVERAALEPELLQELWRREHLVAKDLTPERADVDAGVLGAFTLGFLALAWWGLKREGRS